MVTGGGHHNGHYGGSRPPTGKVYGSRSTVLRDRHCRAGPEAAAGESHYGGVGYPSQLPGTRMTPPPPSLCGRRPTPSSMARRARHQHPATPGTTCWQARPGVSPRVPRRSPMVLLPPNVLPALFMPRTVGPRLNLGTWRTPPGTRRLQASPKVLCMSKSLTMTWPSRFGVPDPPYHQGQQGREQRWGGEAPDGHEGYPEVRQGGPREG